MKLMQSWFGTRKDRESNFHHRGGAVKHVQACLSAKKDGESYFHYCGGLLQLVQAYFSARKDRESSFGHCVDTCRPVYVPVRTEKVVFTTMEEL